MRFVKIDTSVYRIKSGSSQVILPKYSTKGFSGKPTSHTWSIGTHYSNYSESPEEVSNASVSLLSGSLTDKDISIRASGLASGEVVFIPITVTVSYLSETATTTSKIIVVKGSPRTTPVGAKFIRNGRIVKSKFYRNTIESRIYINNNNHIRSESGKLPSAQKALYLSINDWKKYGEKSYQKNIFTSPTSLYIENQWEEFSNAEKELAKDCIKKGVPLSPPNSSSIPLQDENGETHSCLMQASVEPFRLKSLRGPLLWNGCSYPEPCSVNDPYAHNTSIKSVTLDSCSELNYEANTTQYCKTPDLFEDLSTAAPNFLHDFVPVKPDTNDYDGSDSFTSSNATTTKQTKLGNYFVGFPLQFPADPNSLTTSSVNADIPVPDSFGGVSTSYLEDLIDGESSSLEAYVNDDLIGRAWNPKRQTQLLRFMNDQYIKRLIGWQNASRGVFSRDVKMGLSSGGPVNIGGIWINTALFTYQNESGEMVTEKITTDERMGEVLGLISADPNTDPDKLQHTKETINMLNQKTNIPRIPIPLMNGQNGKLTLGIGAKSFNITTQIKEYGGVDSVSFNSDNIDNAGVWQGDPTYNPMKISRSEREHWSMNLGLRYTTPGGRHRFGVGGGVNITDTPGTTLNLDRGEIGFYGLAYDLLMKEGQGISIEYEHTINGVDQLIVEGIIPF